MKKILFKSILPELELELPKPASFYIPEWYKQMESYKNGEKDTNGKGIGHATIKKCMPVFDALTAGYIIVTPVDIRISQVNGNPYYEWASFNPISEHERWQANLHPGYNGTMVPKFHNPWCIKTPKGYSTLFVQPMHRESIFEILPGVVDTDKYTNTVHFPFILKDPMFEGYIPAGTPIAQVIPFKRDDWEIEDGGQSLYDEAVKVAAKLHTKFYDRYKEFFRTQKRYR